MTRLFLLIALWCGCTPLFARDLSTLAAHPQWLRLTHLTSSVLGFKTDIRDPHFFQSAHRNPTDELTATLAALRHADSQTRHTTRCAYPARATWLAEMLDDPDLAADLHSCTELQDWLPAPGGKLMVVQVSGYFGNPASAFGHLLLRMSPGGDAPSRGLLDRGINFGARIPDKEGSAAYILRGLSGGYHAQFSEQPHYLQDHVYTANEARDMWAYELNLPPERLQLMLLHLWELRNIDFNYYFLRKNCAWRVAELLAIAFEQPVGPTHQPYYLPDDVFIALESFKRRTPGIIAHRHFVPSLANRAAHRLANLPTDERTALHAYLNGDRTSLPDDTSTTGLDYLLDLFDYRLARASTEDRTGLLNLKRPVLKARLKHEESLAPTPALPAPALGLLPRTLTLGASTQDKHDTVSIEIGAYQHELINRNRAQLANGALRVAVLKLSQTNNTTRLERLDIIGTTRLGSPVGRLADDQTERAWRAGLGVARFQDGGLSATLNAAYGRAATRPNGTVFGLLDATLWSKPGRADVRLETGWVYRPAAARWATQLQWKSPSASNRMKDPWQLSATLRWQHTRHTAITTRLRRQSDETTTELALQWRW